VLYLAEVQKLQKTFMGGTKGELKLLACQRNDQSWSAVPEEAIPLGEEFFNTNRLNEGALILAELTGNKQVQKVDPAGRSLVTILQRFSQQLEKAKTQEEEIEQWKQSLTFQSQELNRREMEMEARVEQLQQMEDDFERLEQQRQEIDGAREEIERLKEEIDRNRQELEGAWEHLRGEQRRLEERQAEQTGGLNSEQAGKIQELLNRLSGAIAPTDSVREQLNLAIEVVNAQQTALDYHWQQLEQQQASAQHVQAEVDRQTQELQSRKQEWQQAQAALDQAQIELKVQQKALEIRQELVQMRSLQLQMQEDLHLQVSRLAAGGGDSNLNVDIEALEKLPLGDLQETVQNLQQELEKQMRFVNDQEEELTDKGQTIQELQTKINQSSEYDRLHLETELADERDAYQMLDRTLGFQRETLRERESILNQHLRVLQRRQGVVEPNSSDNQRINLEPVLNQLETQRQEQAEELQKLESQIEQMRLSIQQAQVMLTQQTNEQQAKHNEWQSLEQSLLASQTQAAELLAKVQLYRETLQPSQDNLNGIRQKLEAVVGVLNQIQETGDYQLQAIAEMRQMLNGLTEVPQLAAS
jgi:chromosome segregation ATPase